ncbi:hypothetical protein [Pseudomonas putida]|uniref:hypothetical protein n=1 Tax=Pseudomonas putida TaxID=303 RepID=UPI000818F369|nr:hypothetical protein [Pseudomonas putida]OCT32874.1 hypothetical protein A6E20_24580 [Pseudomonas putida]OCT33120.1 hypothetical protein A6E23_24530 [Pseudomonas putida]OCT34883.1 hypothetical protein A6E24_24500 [Pseudomonas putida]OCT41346.1 hypothetical protein A6E19_24645 [Pseudomonas putida]
MKKIVPDPPRLKLINTPYFSIHADLIPPDALAHASELLRGVSETLDEHCRSMAGTSGLNMLANAAHAAETARALIEHALKRM